MAAKMLTRKLPEMTDEVRAMLDVRHQAEQRGNVSPLGRLQWIQTEHGLIRFPAISGEGCGPDLAWAQIIDATSGLHEVSQPSLCVLGQWEGLPPLRINTSTSCPKCRHACDLCDSSGKKLCELCGGQTWIPGNWLPCPGPGCSKEEGRFRADCVTCGGTGQIREQRPCAMCEGTKLMTCPKCAGSGKYSTGRINGSIDWDATPKCRYCDGTTFVGEWKRQDEKQFTNATLLHRDAKGRQKAYRIIGPIREFAIRDCHTLRTRIFDVSPDSVGDLLVLMLPRSKQQKPQKAYLVGGVVRERERERLVSA